MIDLRSDTVTTPSPAMREAVLDAPVADDKRDGDPTVAEVEAAVADRLGMNAGLFCPTGTMANQVAIAVHTDHGQEILHDRWAHVYTSEFAGPARLSGLQSRPIDAGPRGCPTPAGITAALDERTQWPGAGLLTLENTHNKRGGAAISGDAIDAAAEAARAEGLAVHLDGARLGNAAVARDCEMADFTGAVDSATLCLSKGLGAPIGTVLTGDPDFIERARNYRHAFGGGLRQAGIAAAPGLLAIENVARLAEDHENAAVLAERLTAETPLDVSDPETNILICDVAAAGLDSDRFQTRCAERDVRVSTIDSSRVRLVTHLDVDRDDIETAADRIADAV
ncbi:MAG: low specificity L-threonine aldolase [Salinirussus sp.]